MIRDPIPLLQSVLGVFLKNTLDAKLEADAEVNARVPWRPHLLERRTLRGWYIHVAKPDSDSWSQRIIRSRTVTAKLQVGVAGPEHLFEDEEFLLSCQELNAAVLIFTKSDDNFKGDQYFQTVEDMIYSRRLKLSHKSAQSALDRCLLRALSESDKNRKGVLLELLAAVLLSQVDGFEVSDLGISNRTQQMDVLVHNRNVGGTLAASPLVIAEAKNWKNPVGTNEYASFLRKLESRHGRAKLGYLITTGKFTAGVAAERRRDSTSETLIVLVNGIELPSLWRSSKSITTCVERITLDAAIGQ